MIFPFMLCWLLTISSWWIKIDDVCPMNTRTFSLHPTSSNFVKSKIKSEFLPVFNFTQFQLLCMKKIVSSGMKNIVKKHTLLHVRPFFPREIFFLPFRWFVAFVAFSYSGFLCYLEVRCRCHSLCTAFCTKPLTKWRLAHVWIKSCS